MAETLFSAVGLMAMAGWAALAAAPLIPVWSQRISGVAIPLLHIADATAAAIRAQGLSRPGLLATAFTMEQRFYTDRLEAAGLEPIIPGPEDRAEVHRIIYEELCREITTPESEAAYVEIADRLRKAGADCLILGCTEVGMLLGPHNVSVPVFDTTLIHCAAAIEAALS